MSGPLDLTADAVTLTAQLVDIESVSRNEAKIADAIEEWFVAGAVDGFNVMPDVFPSGLELFVDHVVPILRQRGLFRREYRHATLRGHLGLERIPDRRGAARRVIAV